MSYTPAHRTSAGWQPAFCLPNLHREEPMTERVRSQPCTYCPYRRDVPSGVWSAHEYDKLVEYDKPTWDQPAATFGCHATPEFLCHGWAVVHSNRTDEFALLALRIWPVESIPEPAVPLFASGTEAAEHGMRDIETPSDEAFDAVGNLMSRYERLRDNE